jgi:tRNA pseudouridine38-40 synthase
VRTLKHLEVGRSGGLVIAHVSADAFCHSMVRSLMGALLAVGEGKRERSWPASLLTRAERASEVAVAPPHGLTLVAVAYPPGDEALLARQGETRQLRA